MMLLNPIIGNLHNTKTNRYHPILFVESPLPGGPGADVPVRHKSKGHHTDGLDTREEAVAECEKMVGQLKEHCIGEPRLCIEKDFPWDGEDMPTMVIFFGEQAGKTVPVLG